ncbi:hypothetical protein PQR39_26305 [Paraburkholderia sediminicola]|uniref:hypothetical protein n=1 Tax=Paraburkholderia sediminicola TaxID=458836 RepID=UPI0038BDBFAA
MTAPTNRLDGAMMTDEQAAFEDAFKASHEYPEKADQLEFRKGWEAHTVFARAASPSVPAQSSKSCQTGWGDICHMAKHDGVVCPDDSCDIDDGIRAAPAQSGEPVVCIAPACHQWDGTDTCTCERQRAIDTLKRVATALPVLKAMLAKEGLGGVDVADELRADVQAILAAPQPAQTAVALDDERAAFDLKILEALQIADRFCGSFTAEVCPDTIHIPIQEALAKAARATSPQPVVQTERALTVSRDEARYRWWRNWVFRAGMDGLPTATYLADVEDPSDIDFAIDAAIIASLTAVQPASGDAG